MGTHRCVWAHLQRRVFLKMDYKFRNLLGAPYKGGSVAMTGDTLLSPVGNRVSQVRMACHAPTGKDNGGIPGPF